MLPEIFAFPWEGPAIDWSSCSNARMVFEKKRVVKWVFLNKVLLVECIIIGALELGLVRAYGGHKLTAQAMMSHTKL